MAVHLIRKVRDRQPQTPVRIDWSNPVTKGLVFCAVPEGNTYRDLVTNVVGTIVGTPSRSVRSPNGGKARRAEGYAVSSGSASGTYIEWPASSTLRGATMVQEATILFLGGANSNTNGVAYAMGGNTESVSNGDGFVLMIDSNLYSSVGGVGKGKYNSINNASNTALLGAGFANKTYFFGFAVSSNGGSGDWLCDGIATAFSALTNGTTTTNRKAYMHANSSIDASNHDTFALLGLFWDRRITAREYASLYNNPWQIFEPEIIPLFYSTVTAQYARPTSDVSAGTWTASTGSDLFAMLDETSANDSDYITTTTASTCEIALGSLSDPALSTGHIVRYRISATGVGIIVRLREGSTTIASWTHNPAPGSLTTYAQTLSGGEADSIINYAALKLQFEAIT